MSKPLTAKGIVALKPKAQAYATAVGLVPGLYIKTEPTGTKSWFYMYRFGGKQKKLTIGRFPAVGLGEAREAASACARELAYGRDPDAEKKDKADKIQLLEDLCRAYIINCTQRKLSAVTVKEYMRYLGLCRNAEDKLILSKSKGDIISAWEGRAIESITKDEVKVLLAEVAGRGSMIAANRIHGLLRRMFAWGADNDFPNLLPAASVKRPCLLEEKRKRVLEPWEIKALWDASGRLGSGKASEYSPMRDAFRLLLLTCARRSQVCRATFSNFDRKQKIWTLPEKMHGSKGIENCLPITDWIERMLALCPHREGYVFSTDGGKTPIVFQKDKIDLAAAMNGCPVQNWRPHDLRRTGRTGLSPLPIPEGDLVRELVLGHTQKGVHDVYDRYKYLPHKRIALELWEAEVMKIVSATPDLERLAA
jgi:integrase